MFRGARHRCLRLSSPPSLFLANLLRSDRFGWKLTRSVFSQDSARGRRRLDVVQPGIARRMGNRSLCKLEYCYNITAWIAHRQLRPRRHLSDQSSISSSLTRLITSITDSRGFIVVQSVHSGASLQISIYSFSYCPSNSSPAGIRLPSTMNQTRRTKSFLNFC